MSLTLHLRGELDRVIIAQTSDPSIKEGISIPVVYRSMLSAPSSPIVHRTGLDITSIRQVIDAVTGPPVIEIASITLRRRN